MYLRVLTHPSLSRPHPVSSSDPSHRIVVQVGNHQAHFQEIVMSLSHELEVLFDLSKVHF